MIEWIVSSSVLILLSLAVRTLCRTRLSCRARYCLWLVVLVRLLTPVQLFTTGWGVAEIAELSLPNPVLMVSDPEGLLSDSAPLEPDPTLPRAEQEIQWRENRSEYYQQHIKEAEETGVRTVTLADALRAVWIAGAGVLAAVLLISNLRFVRRLRRTRRPCDALCAGMRVYVAEGLSSPCLVGVLRPTAYLTPESVRDERTLRHVLAHETTHRLHGDCLWSLLRLAALCLHWYNPLVWYAVLVSKRDGELACDEATLKRLGEDERAAYGETLLSLVRAATDTRELFSASTAMTAAPMRERIETIAKHPRTKLAALVFALAVLLTATVFAFSKGEERETAPMPEEQTEQRPAARDADSSETLRATGSYEVAAHRIAGSGWSVAIPDEGWTRAGDTWTSDAGSTLSVKWLASRDDCDLAPYMEHWEWASDELNTVTYEDVPNRLRMEAHLYAAPGGGYWQVLTRYDTSLLLLSSFTGLEPKLLEAMAASFTVDESVSPLAVYPDMRPQSEDEAAFFESIAGEYWFLSGAGGWHTELTIGADGTDGAFTGEYSSGSDRSAFSGRFSDPRQINSYTWSIRLLELDASAYGIEGADEVLVYLPGAPVSALPEEFVQWYCAGLSYGRNQIGSTLPTVGLYNVDEGYGWFARSLIDTGWEPLPTDELAAWTEALRSTDERRSGEGGYYVTYPSLVSCFFTSYYGTPRDINLDNFLDQCPLHELMNISDGTATEAEFNALKAAAGDRYYGASAPTWRYRAADINAALMQYAGVTLDDLNTDWRNDERMLYLPEYDAFYNFTSDFGPGTFTPESGMHLGSIVRLDSNWSTLQVSGTPDSFRIMSFTER